MSFQKNEKLDWLIGTINDLLEPVEKSIWNTDLSADGKGLPTILLIGTPRSGSTLITQWMASLDVFAYPSNFLSRFNRAPYVGALIYKMLTDPEYQYRDEFSDVANEIAFSSSIGKTVGLKAPHEFWYFWRRFMRFPEVPDSETFFKENFDFTSFQNELALLKSAFKKPFIMKAHIINWYLESMADRMDNVIYVHLYRDPIAASRSLLKARVKWTGDKKEWFSGKPREYKQLKKLDVYHQVAGQIYFIEKEILLKKHHLGENYIACRYEDFCRNPEAMYNKINHKIRDEYPSYKISDYNGVREFSVSNPASDEDANIRNAYGYFEKKYGTLEF